MWRRLLLIAIFCIQLLSITNGKECQPKLFWSSEDYWEELLFDMSPHKGEAIYLYYYGDGGDRLARVDSKGVLTWSVNLNQDYLYPTPVQMDGLIYLPETSGRNIRAIDSEKGMFVKTIPIQDTTVNITYVTALCGSVIYGVANIKRDLYVVGVNMMGSIIWTSKQHYMVVNGAIFSQPMVTPDCSSVFYIADPYDNNADVTLNCEDPNSGNVLWSQSLHTTRLQALLSGGWAISASSDFKRIAVLTTSVTFQLPTYQFFIIDGNTGFYRYTQAQSRNQSLYSYSNPIFSDNGTTVCFAPDRIFCISLDPGPTDSFKWSYPTNDTSPWSYPHAGTMSTGKIVYYTLRFVVVALNVETAELLWMSPTVWDPEPNYSVELEYVVGDGEGHVIGLGLKELWDYASCDQGFNERID